MKTAFVTALLDIGRGRTFHANRAISFYTESLEKIRMALRYKHFRVFGNVWDAHDVPFSFSDLINTVGTSWYDRIEYLRCTKDGSGLQGESSWYAALTLAKMFLLMRVLHEDSSIEAVYWVDAGFASHQWMDINLLTNMTGQEGFHGAVYVNGNGWHGIGLDTFGPYPGRHVCGALFGGDRKSVSRFFEKFFNLMRECLKAGILPLEEDIFTILEQRGDLDFIHIHEGYDSLAKFHA